VLFRSQKIQETRKQEKRTFSFPFPFSQIK